MWYKQPIVLIGSSEVGYIQFTKKQYIFWSLFLTAWIISFFGYWICVIRRYERRLKPKPAPPAEEETPAEGAEDKPADGMMEQPAPAEGGDAMGEGM